MLESLRTPIAVIMTPGADVPEPKQQIRRIFRDKNICDMAADGKHMFPLLNHEDKVAHKMDPFVTIPAPPQPGTWFVQCMLALPQPDPDDEATQAITSNTVQIKVTK